MKNRALPFSFGLLTGLTAMVVVVWLALPRLMILTHESRYSVDETIAELTRVAREQGWVVPKVYDLQGSLATMGHPDATPMKIVSLCQPDHAYKVLSGDNNKRLTSIMPCRIGVYQLDDGKVLISSMNIALLSRLFGSTVAEAMQQAAAEEDAMLKTVTR